MYNLPTGKKDYIVPLSGGAAAMGERGARRMEGSVSDIASEHKPPSKEKKKTRCP